VKGNRFDEEEQVEKRTYACKGYIICSIRFISLGGTTKDSKVVSVLIRMIYPVRITSYG
jgi:hypothetical protein